jgi:hypothetical protein
VAELVDAPGLGPGGHSPVGVRVPSPAQTSTHARLAPKTHPARARQPTPAPNPGVAYSAASPTGNRFTAATTLGLGPGIREDVGVRVPSPAQTSTHARLAPKTHPARARQPTPAPNPGVAYSAASPTGNRFTAATLGLGPGIREDVGVRVPSPAQTSTHARLAPKTHPARARQPTPAPNPGLAYSAASPTNNRLPSATLCAPNDSSANHFPDAARRGTSADSSLKVNGGSDMCACAMM